MHVLLHEENDVSQQTLLSDESKSNVRRSRSFHKRWRSSVHLVLNIQRCDVRVRRLVGGFCLRILKVAWRAVVVEFCP